MKRLFTNRIGSHLAAPADRRRLALIVLVAGAIPLAVCGGEQTRQDVYAPRSGVVRNDSRWLDDHGNEIYANKGGHITKVGDTWYWVGNKAEIQEGNDIYLYSSKTLGSSSWKQEGKIWDFGDGKFNGNCTLLQNPNNHTFVIVSKGPSFFVSKTVTGPYRQVSGGPIPRPDYNYGGMSVYQEGNAAYLVVSRRRIKGGRNERDRSVGIYQLNADFTAIDEEIFWGKNRGREAMWIFKKADTYYMTSSQTHGWRASGTYFQRASALTGPWSKEEPVRMVPENQYSHGSQQRFIMDIGDGCWVFGGDRYPVESANLWPAEYGRHIMCPVRWEDGKPVVYWRKTWDIASYNWNDHAVETRQIIPGIK